MESVLSPRAKKQNQNSHSSLKGVRYSALRVLKPLSGPNSTIFNDRQIAQQLMEEFGQIAVLLEKCNKKRNSCQLLSVQLQPIRRIINLEEVLAAHDELIHKINREIKALKSADRQLDVPKEAQQNQVFQLAEQLRKQRKEMTSILETHSTRVQKYQQMKAMIGQAQARYKQKFNDRLISYQEFKLHQEEQREDNSQRKRIKEARTSLRLETSIENVAKEGPSKTMRELQSKKSITEAAIKNSKKKHQTEIAELRAKIQFLRDEDALLAEKVSQTQTEKAILVQRLKGRMQKIHIGQRR